MINKILPVVLVCVAVGLCLSGDAQNRPRKKTNNPNRATDTTKPANNGGGASDYFSSPGTTAAPAGNTKKPGGINTGGVGNAGFRDTTPAGPAGPVKFVAGSGNILTDTIAPTMRAEDAVDRNLVKDKAPLDYQYIREDDAVYMQKVWRVIDTREKMNLGFTNPAQENGNSENFLAILYKAVTEGQTLGGSPIVAFKDDRFSQPYTDVNEFKQKFSGGIDTVDKYDLNGNVIGREARPREFKVDSVYQYQIKEEWIFDKQTSRLYVRILGIAPMMKTFASDGTALSKDLYPLFWIYYPDLRPILAKRDVYNGKNYGARMSWEELFESRMFSSYIIKSTLDNPFNQTLAEMYPNNTLFRLLEGDHVKEKIFDYEQALWQY